MKKHKNKIIIAVIIAVALGLLYWYGGASPALQKNAPQADEIISSENTDISLQSESKEAYCGDEKATQKSNQLKDESVKDEQSIPSSDERNGIKVEPSYEEKTTIDLEEASPSEKELTCTLSVRCDTILSHMDWLSKEKVDIVPKNGIIYAQRTVTFSEGETVYDLLVREMKKNGIHLEFEMTPLYNTAYIEGIANLYEYDCKELSGWMYKVNGWFPNYGCSLYQLKQGDKVEWVYTCDLGADVGGNYSTESSR